jgi:nucleotidyltransferase AbiEii toxin of type IV toxin-antitoxin system
VDEFACRTRRERAEVFEETSARRGIGRPAIAEKDFWVCWTLHQLLPFFGDEASSAERTSTTTGLVFKGGTSLSKVYHVIDRFSEDIDLTIDRETLGFTGDREPGNSKLSKRKRDRLFEQLADAAAQYVNETIRPVLAAALKAVDDKSSGDVGVDIDSADPQTIHLSYPRSLDEIHYGSARYVRSEVRLEFGARGELWPAHRADVRPYAAEEFTSAFTTPSAVVSVLDLSRTLWEKATILHQVAHTGIRASRDRMSRHYYDLSCLVQNDQGRAALDDSALLERVAEYKRVFYPQAGARYDLARRGSLRLIPGSSILEAIRRDYAAMKEMFFNEPPAFDQIIDVLREVERSFNSAS